MATPGFTQAAPGARVLTTGTTTEVAANELLKGDHRQVEGWFAEFDRAESLARRQTLADQICKALQVHMVIEEEIFYPAFLDAVGDEPLYDAAESAHADAKEVIADIQACDAGDDVSFDLLVKSLARMIQRHVTDEEQHGGLFDEAQQSELDMHELGARLERRKLELMDDRTTDEGYDEAVL
jgi:hypothetical protein